MTRLSPFRLLIIACVTGLIAVRLVSWLRTDRVPSNLDSQPTGSASVRGRVVDRAGKPIAVANVRLASENPRVWRSTTTDAEGRFTIAKLPAADYQLIAAKQNFLEPLEPLHVAVGDGLRVNSPDLTLVLGGTIRGTVYGEDGTPLAGQLVRAVRAHQPFMGTNFDVVMNRPMFTGTDDHGRYVVPGLPADEFYVTVSLDRAETLRFYHPDASRRAEAKTISITPGEVVDDVDIRARHVVTSTITVLVTGPDRRPIAAGVELLRADDERRPRFASSAADGKAAFDGVTPDRYWITAHTIIRDHEHWGMKEIDLLGQPVTASLALEPDSIVTGTVTFDVTGAKPAPALTFVSIFFRPADELTTASTAQATGIRTASVRGDGRFVVQLPPGQYVLEAPVPGWRLTRALVDGRDRLQAPITVRAGQSLTAALTFEAR